MEHTKPLYAPNCWGKKYQDGEEECTQCRYQDTCRPEMLYQVTKTNQPMLRPTYVPLPPRPTSLPQLPTAPPTPKPYFTPPNYPITAPSVARTFPAQVTPQPPQQPTYYQQSTGFSLPNSTIQNPLTPWHRPGAPSPPYYFTQYPGERTGTRLVKNVILRMLEALCAELLQYFRHWTWPPHQ